MVCELVCLPALAVLTWLAQKLGLGEGVIGIFLGALIVGISELESKYLKKKVVIDGKEVRQVRFPFQTTIITLINLIVVSLLVTKFQWIK